MDEYLELTFDIFDEVGQRAAVLSSLTPDALAVEILREFEGLDSGNPAAYALSLASGGAALAPRRSLADQGVQSGDRLVFGWTKKAATSARQAISQPGQAALQEQSAGKVFPIAWQPARIGRRDADPVHNELLLVNAEQLPNGGRVSRTHAQITERGGVYYLESLSSQNPTLLNGRVLPARQPVRLAAHDRIDLGQSGITLIFIQSKEP